MTVRQKEPSLEGTTLRGKYRVGGLVGQGGMGTVWAAEHLRTGRRVAIKILAERFLDHARVVERFGREARAAGSIQHPGIVEVLDLDRTEAGVPFLVMECLTGETLAERIHRLGRLSPREVIAFAKQLLDALEAAHRHGVVHRDLKPDNVHLVPRSGGGETLKILDFGISAKEDERISGLTQEGSVLGTPHYMAPEQAKGAAQVDGRADLYALGVVMYECLVGDIPFDASNYNQLIYVILNEVPRPPSTTLSDLDPDLERFVLRLLQKNPADRFDDARTAKEDLERIEQQLTSPRRPPSVDELTLDIPSEPARSVRRSRAAIPIPNVVHSPGIDSDPFSENLATSGEPSVSLELDEDALVRPKRVPSAHRSSAPSHSSLRPPAPNARWTSRLVVAGLVVSGVSLIFWRFADTDPRNVEVSVRSSTAQRSLPVDDNRVRIEVQHLPAGARLRLDGLPTGNPPIRLRRDGATHVLEIRAPGYETRRIEFRATADRALSGGLRPQAGVAR